MLVLKRMTILGLLAFTLFTATGCGSKSGDTDAYEDIPSTEQPAQEEELWEESSERIEGESVQDVVYLQGEIMPILSPDGVTGYINFNWVQRLGIWDYNNETACAAGVTESYTLNFHVDLSDTIQPSEQRILSVEPYILDKNKSVVGSPCCVGWSGFPTTAQFYDRTQAVDIEVGVQPHKALSEDCLLLLTIEDNLGTEYQDIFVDVRTLLYAETVGGLETDGREVHCINGASFSVSVSSVNINEVKDFDGVVQSRWYDVDYAATHRTAASSSIKDPLFDDGNNNALRTQYTIGVDSNVDSNKVYEGDNSIKRQVYADDSEMTDFYTTTDFNELSVGETGTYTINRKIPDTTGIPRYTRVYFEFPEEASVRSLEEMRNFDGRFLVIQKPIEDRVIPYTPEDEW